MTLTTGILAAAATPYATFWSGGQKIARNGHGVMAAYITSQNAAYTAQGWEILFWPDLPANAVVVASGTNATNPPVVEAARSGEFYAVLTDWSLNKIWIYYWADISQNQTPVIKEFTGTLGGKYSALFDEYRRKLFVIGNESDILHTFDDEGALLSNTDISNPGASGDMEYPMLGPGPEGRIHLYYASFDSTAQGGVSYRSVGYGWSPDGVYWTPGTTPSPQWSGAPWATLPVAGDEYAPFTVTRGEESAWNTLLSGGFADQDYTHIFYSVAPAQSKKFTEKGGAETSMVYLRFDRKKGGAPALRAPFEAGTYRPWFPGSTVTRRGAKLYHLALDGEDLKVMTSGNDGADWTLEATYSLPGMDAAPGKFAHYLSCFRGRETDSDIIGLYSKVGVSLDDWAAGADPVGLASEAVYFRLQLSGGAA